MKISDKFLKNNNFTHHQCIMLAVFCADKTIDIFEQAFPDFSEPRIALESARKCAESMSSDNKQSAERAFKRGFSFMDSLPPTVEDKVRISAGPSIYAASTARRFSVETSYGGVMAAYLDAGYAIQLNTDSVAAKLEFREEFLKYALFLKRKGM